MLIRRARGLLPSRHVMTIALMHLIIALMNLYRVRMRS
jgi:hypothetical protein